MYWNEHALFDWCSCRMGLPVDKLDRDDHTHAREKQGEGEEIQSEISIRTPPPMSKKKKRRYKKRYLYVCLHDRTASSEDINSSLEHL